MDVTMIEPVWWIVIGVTAVVALGLAVWAVHRWADRAARLKSGSSTS